MPSSETATLLIHCPDKPGLVHDVTGFIASHHGNIIDLQQHIDPGENAFFMRLEWSMDSFLLDRTEVDSRFSTLGRSHGIHQALHASRQC